MEEEREEEGGGEGEKSMCSEVKLGERVGATPEELGWQLDHAKPPVEGANRNSSHSPLTSPSGARGGLKLGGKVRAAGDGKQQKESGKEDGGGGGGGGGGSGRGWMREEDVQRLAKQEAWEKELDFFADMEPAIARGSLSPRKAPTSAPAPVSVSVPVSTRPGARTALEYQPTGEEVGINWSGCKI